MCWCVRVCVFLRSDFFQRFDTLALSTVGDVNSHRMIGVFRMIILLTGQIILRTRMIGRDDQGEENGIFAEFLTSGKA